MIWMEVEVHATFTSCQKSYLSLYVIKNLESIKKFHEEEGRQKLVLTNYN